MMRKSRLQGALEAAREGVAGSQRADGRLSNNIIINNNSSSENSTEDTQPHHVRLGGSQQQAKANPRPEELTLQSVCSNVKERFPESEHATVLTVGQIPIAVRAMGQVVSKMREASADVLACPSLLQALRANSQTPRTECESQPAMEQLNKDATGWYTLGKVAGRGTFGRIYHAQHRISGSRVAIKTYVRQEGSGVCCSSTTTAMNGATNTRRSRNQAQNQRSSEALDWKRVRKEARVMEKLRPHPNVVRYFESFESATRFDLVMELVDGCDLCAYLMQQPGRKLGEKSARRVFSALCSAVASLHAQDIIHRDLKLENVLLETQHGGERRPILIDFGFSELESDPLWLGSSSTATADVSKNFCGTPAYMAPEVLTSSRFSGKAADVWSLGVILYVLLCGRFPFLGTSLHQLHQSARNPWRLLFPKGVSPGSQALVRAILVTDPSRRPSARQILSHEWFVAAARPGKPVISVASSSATRDLQALEAFSNWSSRREMIADALSDLYGLDPAVLLSTPRDRRLNHVSALVEVAGAAGGHLFRLLLHEQPRQQFDRKHEEDTSLSETQHGRKCTALARTPRPQLDGIELPASSHRQQLEHLIGLVKHSLHA